MLLFHYVKNGGNFVDPGYLTFRSRPPLKCIRRSSRDDIECINLKIQY